MNHYVVLGVPIDADDQLIRSAFRTLVRRYHPDVGQGSSPEKFRRLVEAYETLADPVRRQEYDRSLQSAQARPAIPVEPLTRPARPATFRYQFYAAAPRFSFDLLFEEIWQTMEEDFWRRW
jgi:curved DNA-binding protein CbpA